MTTLKRGEPTLADLDENQLLAKIFPQLSTSEEVLVGPGDDAALLRVRSGSMLATTDTMVRGRDWLDEWSSGVDVGHKLVIQNVADIAAMGGRCTGLLVTMLADTQTPLRWVHDFNVGVNDGADATRTVVIGGDLSSAPAGLRAVSITALGERDSGVFPVLRSGAQPGEVVAVHGSLGRAAAGLLLLQRNLPDLDRSMVRCQVRSVMACEQGPIAARAGATAMLDISDGLVRDAGRIATASRVQIALDRAPLQPDIDALVGAIGEEAANDCVLTGGEEHSLLACFLPGRVPDGWRAIGQVRAGVGVTVDGQLHSAGGWDHFSR